MNTKQIEENIKTLVADYRNGDITKDEFIYEMMLGYGHRKSSITRVRSGERNLSKVPGEIHFKLHLYFKHSNPDSVHTDIDRMKSEKFVTKNKIRFVIATDFEQFLALDTKTNDSLDIQLKDLPKHFDFFLPWAGIEKAIYQGENPADVKAAEKMAKLFDLIKSDNFDETNKDDKNELHNLNVFLTRLLFCFFAEDTEIFETNQFSHAIESHTKDDGSDLNEYLDRLFEVLNLEQSNRKDLPEYLSNFPFVNGGLFAEKIPSPKFSVKSRKILIECGSELDWSDINPDIFGSMIQAVVHPEQRGGMGMHYTSVTNIMKVIEPLFLSELNEELEHIELNIDEKRQPSRLRKLQNRIASLKIFDPACGSGNFLIIAYKEMRMLEMEIIRRLQELNKSSSGSEQDDLFSSNMFAPASKIRLSQFFGIELDDFAHEVAILSLWLAEHQMNMEFKAEFGDSEPTLPLKVSGNIVCENATRVDWNDICPHENHEVIVLGNPPYLGSKNQDKDQKEDMNVCFDGITQTKSLDYICCWFIKAALYIKERSRFAFVSTNSICQGTQVPLLWPIILRLEKEIYFAYKDFVWSNNAKNKAGVTCSIVGVRVSCDKPKYLFYDSFKRAVKNISPYLIESGNTVVVKSSWPISELSRMQVGNEPYDGGNLIFTTEEKELFLEKEPDAAPFF